MGKRTFTQETASRSARRGRGAYLDDRVTGSPDPGAVSASIVLASLVAAIGHRRNTLRRLTAVRRPTDAAVGGSS